MNHETAEKPRSHRWARALLLALLAVIVVGIGTVLVPRDAGKPTPAPFSETARSEALASAESLRGTASLLAGTTSGGASGSETSGDGGLSDTVILLTSQGRALLSPSGPSASSSRSTVAHASESPASPSPASSNPGAATGSPTRATFVSALSSSASRRLADAAKADGGIARLLAAVGTSQLIEASRLATLWGLPVPATPSEAASPGATPSGATPPSCPTLPTTSPTAASPSGAATAAADLPGALASVVSSEQEAIYAYQVAVTKLDPKGSATAATWLARHQELLRGAEAQGRLHCITTPPREAGYRLPASFAAKPGTALGSMESSSLAAYADLVGLSEGETRQWAIDGLVDAAKRSQAWGAPVGPFPGLLIDTAALPPFPSAIPTPTPTPTP